MLRDVVPMLPITMGHVYVGRSVGECNVNSALFDDLWQIRWYSILELYLIFVHLTLTLILILTLTLTLTPNPETLKP